jgi:DNA processing protein
VIGSRSADALGQQMAATIGSNCAAAGYPVVSGLAAGSDTAFHRGCIDGDEPSVAFLAHGLEHVFPPENKSLADQIVAEEGCSGECILARS